jgi:exodeoxyribonuclease VII large subunit
MKVYTVEQINSYIKNIIASDYMLKHVCIKGEISNCKYHSMGHIYFSIKDEKSSMPCVMFKGDVRDGLKFRLQDGQSVTIKGSVTVYERDGKYQLVAKEITQDGTGQLYILYEQLKEKLYQEGLFDFEAKKPICKYPKTVGIVTASTGAAIQDIINIAKRRNPYVQLILYPAKVQGQGAAETIVKGIQTLDAMGLDTIIIGRGGGSIEDLWAFNEEIVARAIYAAKTPIISGTGHEVDNTIADYVADLRAPTPSAACELAIPDVMSVLRQVEDYRSTMQRIISNRSRMYELRLNNYKLRLEKANPKNTLQYRQQYLSELYTRMEHAIQDRYRRMQHRLELDVAKLNGLSPTAKLINGFGYISANDKPLLSVRDVEEGQPLKVTLHDGEVEATVTTVKSTS